MIALVEVTKTNQIASITEDHVRQYRDQELERISGSTLKKLFGYLKGLFNVAVEEKWISVNPFDGVTLRYVKTKPKPKQVTTVDHIDQKVSKLSDLEQCLYWIMRYTGTHISEAAGAMIDDIDLENGVIHIKANELRPLKNDYRQRELPIIKPLARKLHELLPKKVKGYIFMGFYDEKQQRFGASLKWQKTIGISPKICRDTAATVLRDNDVNERVIGSILGHTPRNSTGVYGSVSMEAKRNALGKLVQ